MGGSGGGDSTGSGGRRFGTIDDIRSRTFPNFLQDTDI